MLTCRQVSFLGALSPPPPALADVAAKHKEATAAASAAQRATQAQRDAETQQQQQQQQRAQPASGSVANGLQQQVSGMQVGCMWCCAGPMYVVIWSYLAPLRPAVCFLAGWRAWNRHHSLAILSSCLSTLSPPLHKLLQIDDEEDDMLADGPVASKATASSMPPPAGDCDLGWLGRAPCVTWHIACCGLLRWAVHSSAQTLLPAPRSQEAASRQCGSGKAPSSGGAARPGGAPARSLRRGGAAAEPTQLPADFQPRHAAEPWHTARGQLVRCRDAPRWQQPRGCAAGLSQAGGHVQVSANAGLFC